jgi:hypothetical protein
MKVHDLLDSAIPMADKRLLFLEMKQEHELLKQELQEIYSRACAVRSDYDVPRLNRKIRQLNEVVKQFMTEWHAHIEWEEAELFPYVTSYLGEEPDLFALMEQEYELAEQFICAFLQTLDRAVIPVPHDEAYRMASYLLQAYAVMKNRFIEEEEILLELTDHSNRYDF